MVNTLNEKQPKCFPIYSIYNWISIILLWYTRVITDWTFPVPATTPIHLADHQTFHQSSVLLSNRYQTCKITQSHQNLQKTWGRAPNKFLLLLQFLTLNDCITYAFLVGKHFGGCQDVGVDEGLVNPQEGLVPVGSNPGGSSSIPGPYRSYTCKINY